MTAEFDLDRRYGEAGELETLGILKPGSTYEVKHKTFVDDLFYVEYEQLPHHSVEAGIYKPSGIAISTADYWAFVIADTGVVVIVPRERLQAVARLSYKIPDRRKETNDSDNPTRGVLVAFKELLKRL